MMGILRSKKQEGFAQDFVLHGDASKAYRDNYSAGKMKPESIHVRACELKKSSKVAVRIIELSEIATKVAEERFSLNAEWLLGRFAEIDDMDVLDILNDDMSPRPISQWPLAWRKTISGLDVSSTIYLDHNEQEVETLLKKIKWPDKVKNLEMIGRHVKVQAFKDRLEAEVTLTNFDIPVDMPAQEAADIYKQMIAGNK